ncbi:ABC transporter permease protein [gamma proteobacterium IMCC2047]|nr:ABC transporter permease protein [gamma proteobacterium IMCC2047]
MIRRADIIYFSWQVLIRHRFRSVMVLLAMALGVASIVVLTALGEGARRYVLGEFAFLGSDVLVMLPGKKETTGGLPPLMGTAARDITLQDVEQLSHRISAISDIAPLVMGSAEVSFKQRSRNITVLGSTAALISVRQLTLAQGRNLDVNDVNRATKQCLIGQTLKTELFGREKAIGSWIRAGDYRCRVVGVLQGRGDAFGMDLSDSLIMPVVSAQQLFDSPGLFRVIMKIRHGYPVDDVKARVIALMKDLHQGEEDVTVISPDAMLATFDDVFGAMTLGVGAIAAISMVVAGVLIMNITLINVSQRTEEIGLLKALGARAVDIQQLFLIEALMTTIIGAGIGLLGGLSIVTLARWALPEVPFYTPVWAVFSALLVALIAGLGFAWGPSKRASRLLPVDALYRRK